VEPRKEEEEEEEGDLSMKYITDAWNRTVGKIV
jgi:hypothetical protein